MQHPSMQELIAGVRHFQQREYPPRNERFAELATGQAPQVFFITCSDSRVNPHLVTNTEPGDLFVLRNAGNLIPSYDPEAAGADAGTVEFAVAGLKVRDIVVCGHSGCGAMSGLCNPEGVASLPAVARWIAPAQPVIAAVDRVYGTALSADQKLARAIELNALYQLDHLSTHPAVVAALENGTVAMHAWVYDIGSGAVTCFDEATGRFVNLGDSPRPVTRYPTVASAVSAASAE